MVVFLLGFQRNSYIFCAKFALFSRKFFFCASFSHETQRVLRIFFFAQNRFFLCNITQNETFKQIVEHWHFKQRNNNWRFIQLLHTKKWLTYEYDYTTLNWILSVTKIKILSTELNNWRFIQLLHTKKLLTKKYA